MENARTERTFALSPGVVPTIVARTPTGAIHMYGEERDDVAVSVTVEPADAVGREVEVVVEQTGETIRAEVRGIRGETPSNWLRGNMHARIAIEVRTPLRSIIEADGASASLHIERLDGTVRGRTASGDIHIDHLTNGVTITTASGDVRAHALSGAVQVQTASGDITLERGSGDLTIHTASGDTTLTQITGRLDVSAASGDCSVRSSALTACHAKTASGDLVVATPLAPDGDYDFSTVSGDLLLLVPGETRATVSLKTVSGDLSCALPASSDGGKRNRTLQINGGGVAVRVKIVSGDCTIRAASEHLPPMPTGASLATRTDLRSPTRPPAALSLASPNAPLADAAQETDFTETLAVLQAVERGELTIDEAMEKLDSLEGDAHAAPLPSEQGSGATGGGA